MQIFFSYHETQQLIHGTGTAIWWVTEPHLRYRAPQSRKNSFFFRVSSIQNNYINFSELLVPMAGRIRTLDLKEISRVLLQWATEAQQGCSVSCCKFFIKSMY